MPSQTDLDQGGTFRTKQRFWMGPSVGWIEASAMSILPITVAGTVQLALSTTLVTVSVNGAVTINLPAFKGSAVGAGAVPGGFVGAPIIVVDIGGFALANPITINAAAGETIDGQASVSLSSSFGAFTFQPNVINGGSILVQ